MFAKSNTHTVNTPTCSGQSAAVPSPSILSLRIPRTDEKGLWPTWEDGCDDDDDDDDCNQDCEDDKVAGRGGDVDDP